MLVHGNRSIIMLTRGAVARRTPPHLALGEEIDLRRDIDQLDSVAGVRAYPPWETTCSCCHRHGPVTSCLPVPRSGADAPQQSAHSAARFSLSASRAMCARLVCEMLSAKP